jgi:hypothetical protein
MSSSREGRDIKHAIQSLPVRNWELGHLPTCSVLSEEEFSPIMLLHMFKHIFVLFFWKNRKC